VPCRARPPRGTRPGRAGKALRHNFQSRLKQVAPHLFALVIQVVGHLGEEDNGPLPGTIQRGNAFPAGFQSDKRFGQVVPEVVKLVEIFPIFGARPRNAECSRGATERVLGPETVTLQVAEIARAFHGVEFDHKDARAGPGFSLDSILERAQLLEAPGRRQVAWRQDEEEDSGLSELALDLRCEL
jgi:hypothetical protein